MILPFVLLAQIRVPVRYEVSPLVADRPYDGGFHQAIWQIDGARVKLSRGYSILALSESPVAALLYGSDGEFAVADSEGRLRALPKSAEWYGLDPQGRVLSLRYESGRYVVRRNGAVVARTGVCRPGFDPVDAPRIVCAVDGHIAVGYDSGRRATDKGEHAIDTAVFDESGRCVRTWRNVTPGAFVGDLLVAAAHFPFVMQPEIGLNRVLSVRTGRSVLEFGGDYAISDRMIVSLTYGKDSVVNGGKIVWPPEARGGRLRTTGKFVAGSFLTLVQLRPL